MFAPPFPPLPTKQAEIGGMNSAGAWSPGVLGPGGQGGGHSLEAASGSGFSDRLFGS